MKRLFKVLGTIAMLAVLLLSFAACDDLLGSPPKGNPTTDADTYKPVVYTSYDTDGTKYELTITRTSKAAIQFTPATGDSYTLTITTKAGATQISTGQITVSGTTFTLKHTGTGETFSVTVSANSSSGGSMISIAGDIPIDNSTTKVPAPATLTPQAPVQAANNLTGTIWKTELDGNGKLTYILEFSSVSAYTMDMKMINEYSVNYRSFSGTYTENGNKVVLTDNSPEKLEGVINDNTLVFHFASMDLTFTKQTTQTKTLSVAIWGTTKPGYELAANVEKNFTGDIEYQWQRDGTDISDETEFELRLGVEDTGKAIRVKVTCGGKSAVSTAVTIQPVELEISISQNNNTLSASVGMGNFGFASGDNGLEYQWQRRDSDNDSWVDIPNATSWQYILQAEDAGKKIKVKVTGYGNTFDSNVIQIPAVIP